MECLHLMLRGTEDGSMDWEPTMAASTGRMAMEERMVYGFRNMKNYISMLATWLIVSFLCLRHEDCLECSVDAGIWDSL